MGLKIILLDVDLNIIGVRNDINEALKIKSELTKQQFIALAEIWKQRLTTAEAKLAQEISKLPS